MTHQEGLTPPSVSAVPVNIPGLDVVELFEGPLVILGPNGSRQDAICEEIGS